MTDIRASHVRTPALVYLRGLRGVDSQVWWQPVPDGDGHYRDRILAWHPLDGVTAGLPFDVLSRIHPPPEMPALD